MPTIKLNYEQMAAISSSMKTQAASFQNNHNQLLSSARSIGSNFSGPIPNMMVESLNEMNADVKKIQETLVQLSDLALNAAQTLRSADQAAKKSMTK